MPGEAPAPESKPPEFVYTDEQLSQMSDHVREGIEADKQRVVETPTPDQTQPVIEGVPNPATYVPSKEETPTSHRGKVRIPEENLTPQLRAKRALAQGIPVIGPNGPEENIRYVHPGQLGKKEDK